MKTFLMRVVLTASLLVLSIADLPNSSLSLGFVKNAEAIIGMPWTPMSFAGVARRSMYREAAYGAVAANAAAMNAAAANAAYANECRCGSSCGGSGASGRCRRPRSCLRVAHRYDCAIAPPWMHLNGHQRRQLFQLRRRLLPGRFPGQQYRVYRVSPLRGMSDECRVTKNFFL